MGQAPPSEECNTEGRGTPFVKAGEFSFAGPIIREWTTKPLKLARQSDVLVCVVGATCGKINRGADCAIGRSVAAVRSDPGKLDHGYLFRFLETWSMRLRQRSQGAAQTVITREMIAELPLSLPPLPEQRRIAAILDKADALRAKRREAIAKLDQLLQSVFLDMFGDPTKPAKWPMKKLGDVTLTTSGGTPDRSVPANYCGDIPWVKSGELNAGEVWETEERISQLALDHSSAKLVPAGTILLAMYGATAGVVAELKIAATTNQAICCITPGPEIRGRYLVSLLRRLTPKLLSSRVGGAQPNLNQGVIRSLSVPIPPIHVQDAFVAVENRVASLRISALDAGDASGALFSSLQQKAFDGTL